MLIPLAVSTAAALAMLGLIFGTYWLAARAAQGDGLSLGSIRWYPSPLALLLLVPVAAFVMWRFSLGFLIIPIVLPFFWRRGFGERFAAWTRGRQRPDRSDEERPPDDW